MSLTKATLKARKNKASPIDADLKTGDLLDEFITKFNALCAKLDADAGVTDTNYAATLGIKTLETRQ